MTREDIFDQKNDEGSNYGSLDEKVEITLPLTKRGFDNLMTEITKRYGLPNDDASYMVIAGYIHHIPNEQDTTTLAILGKVLRKSVANSTSWRIDQEIKMKRNTEMTEARKKKEEQDELARKARVKQQEGERQKKRSEKLAARHIGKAE